MIQQDCSYVPTFLFVTGNIEPDTDVLPIVPATQPLFHLTLDAFMAVSRMPRI